MEGDSQAHGLPACRVARVAADGKQKLLMCSAAHEDAPPPSWA
jgi:hypothetical protein